MIIVSNCGFDSRHRTGFDIRRPNGNGVYTLMFIKTEAFFEIDGKLIGTTPNTAILYDKMLIFIMVVMRSLTVMIGFILTFQRKNI